MRMARFLLKAKSAIWGVALCSSLMLMLSACDHYSHQLHSQALNNITPAAGTSLGFSDYLAMEYRDLAVYENYRMMDYQAAEYFTKKAMAASEGRNVQPSRVMDYDIAPEYQMALGQARARLVDALHMSDRVANAPLLARAQAQYDCWIEQQAESHQPGDILACKFEFQSALMALSSNRATHSHKHDG